MKNKTIAFGFVLALAGVFLTSTIMAQAQASPAATAKGTVKGANITINYSSPSVKGRKIWGDLVPYDKVWRAGANEATIFETDKDIKVEGKKLAKGKYSLYAIPGEKEWTIIFNSATGQWGINRDGTTTQDPAKDVLRVMVHAKKSSGFQEKLVYTISAKGFDLIWENVDVPVFID
jgi:Protein of unknown function (DUF2911)